MSETEVGVSIERTINTGNFENLRISISLKRIVEGGPVAALQAYDRMYESALEKLQEREQEINDTLKKA